MNRLGRGIEEVRVARMEVVRGQYLAHRDREIEQHEERARDDGETMSAQLPPHQPPLAGHVVALLARRHRLDGIGVEGSLRDVMREMRGLEAILDIRTHRVVPPCSRMRGSSSASRRSESSTPNTVRVARNMRKEPARYMSWLRSA